MKEILLLNPRKKKRGTTRKRTTKRRTTRRRTTRRTTARRKPVARRVTAARKGASTMARKRTTRKRRAPRRNPSRVRRATSAVRRRTKRSVTDLNFKAAMKNVPVNALGMFLAKWAAKKFGTAATETDPGTWNYASYLKGAAGAAIGGILLNMWKQGSGQKVLEGGLSLMAYKLVQNELIPNSPFWSGQLGGANDRYPGVIEENDEGTPYILGEDNQWYPLEGADEDRFMIEPGYGSSLVEPGPLGDALVEPGPLGASNSLDALYRRSFVNR